VRYSLRDASCSSYDLDLRHLQAVDSLATDLATKKIFD
jgi:hypothetical protein